MWRHYIYTIWRSELQYFRQNYTTMKTYRWTTWNSNRLLQGRPRPSASLRCIIRLLWRLNKTVRRLCHWNFHLLSFWLALSLPCDVIICKNKWEILMITSSLLSNVRHRAMITPVRPSLTRLIYISPSCWIIYRSFEIILEMGTVHWIELRIQCSMQIHCFKKTISPIWIMF